jgi:AcrR family transcriptional regulator
MPADTNRQPATQPATQAATQAASQGATQPASQGANKGATPAPGRRLRRAERREQLLAAATRAFAHAGFAATSLDDIAAQAGISRAILYRHFDSKADLYRAVLDRAIVRLAAAVGTRDYTDASVDALLGAAADDPDGFRLMFRQATREPEFRQEVDRFRAGMVATAQRELAGVIPDRAWARWAAQLAPVVAIEAVMAWLDAGRPDPAQAADRVRQALAGVIRAARQP